MRNLFNYQNRGSNNFRSDRPSRPRDTKVFSFMQGMRESSRSNLSSY